MTDRTTVEERIARLAAQAAAAESEGGSRRQASPQDYVYDKAQEAFWDLQDRTLNSAEAVDASIPLALWRVEEGRAAPAPVEGEARRPGRPAGARRERPVRPSQDIMRVENDQFVENSTWFPGEPQIIRDVLINEEGTRVAPGRRAYNQYSPPPPPVGNPEGAGPWIEHVKKLWPAAEEHEFFFDYCAHMVQKPGEKCNVAIVLSGAQGIGKDAALGPVREAVGKWNCKAISPDDVFSAFSPWKQTLMLIVNEVRPSKDEFHASSFYNIMKDIIASTAGGTIPMNDKHVKLRYVINVMRVFMTTNDHMALFIEDDDRRLMVMHSRAEARWNLKEGDEGYFDRLFGWMETGGGYEDIGAWLAARDVSRFNPKAPAPRTAGKDAIASSWSQPDDGVAFALEQLGQPDVLFGSELANPQFDNYEEVMAMLKSPRKIAYRMTKAGYAEVKHPYGNQRWEFEGPSGRVRSRKAFFREGGPMTAGEIASALEQRGKRLVGAAQPS